MPLNDSTFLLSADTVTSVAAVNNTLSTDKGIFKDHLLQVVNNRATFPLHVTPDWLTISLFAVIMLFTWYKIFYHRMFMQLMQAFFSMATTNQIVRDESILLQRASLNASVIFYLAGGLFLYQISIFYNWNHPWLGFGFTRFLTFSCLIAVIYSAKMVGLRILSNIFNIDRPASTYIFTIFLFNMVAGLILIPIIILITYAPEQLRDYTILIVLILLGAILAYRLVRAIIIWMSIPRARVFYLFLYLCAFEVAPLLLIRKVVLMQ